MIHQKLYQCMCFQYQTTIIVRSIVISVNKHDKYSYSTVVLQC